MVQNNSYSISEIAAKLGISLKATRRMIASGEIASIKQNNTYRIEKEYFDGHLHEFLSKSQIVENNLRKEKIEHIVLNNQKGKTDIVNWADISSFWANPSKSEMTYVDLFCGAGGLSK